MHTFSSFPEWRTAITLRCGLTLSRDYCSERISALQNPSIPATRNFLDQYGEAYRGLVISWFKQALREAP